MDADDAAYLSLMASATEVNPFFFGFFTTSSSLSLSALTYSTGRFIGLQSIVQQRNVIQVLHYIQYLCIRLASGTVV